MKNGINIIYNKIIIIIISLKSLSNHRLEKMFEIVCNYLFYLLRKRFWIIWPISIHMYKIVYISNFNFKNRNFKKAMIA